MKFRKKPVVIEAWRVGDLIFMAQHAWRDLPATVAESYERGDLLFLPDRIDVRTEEGTMRGETTDMLIRGVKGEFYPCKPDIFAATYEPVVEGERAPESALIQHKFVAQCDALLEVNRANCPGTCHFYISSEERCNQPRERHIRSSAGPKE